MDKLEESAKETLDKPTDKEITKMALKESANSSTARINRILYESRKFLHQTKQNNNKNPKYKDLNIVKSLTSIYNDIEEFRVDPLSKFMTR